MRSNIKWLRLHHCVIHDPKVLSLSADDRWFWIQCLVLASENEPRGVLPAREDICQTLRMRRDHLDARLDRLIMGTLIDPSMGSLSIHSWGSWQFASDDSYQRVKAHRDGKRNVSKTKNETASESDTDTDTENTSLIERTLSSEIEVSIPTLPISENRLEARLSETPEPAFALNGTSAPSKRLKPKSAEPHKSVFDAAFPDVWANRWNPDDKKGAQAAFSKAGSRVMKERNLVPQAASEWLKTMLQHHADRAAEEGTDSPAAKVYMATWLNGERYNDGVAEQVKRKPISIDDDLPPRWYARNGRVANV